MNCIIPRRSILQTFCQFLFYNRKSRIEFVILVTVMASSCFWWKSHFKSCEYRGTQRELCRLRKMWYGMSVQIQDRLRTCALRKVHPQNKTKFMPPCGKVPQLYLKYHSYTAVLRYTRRHHSSGAVWESRWPSWAVRPNEPSGFSGRKAKLNHASALVSVCP